MNLRRLAAVAAAIASVEGVVAFRGAGPLGGLSLAKDWWLVPLSASIASLAALGAAALALRVDPASPLRKLTTSSYLVQGPAFAALNLAAIAPGGHFIPGWVEETMLVLVICSAWLYYKTVQGQE